MGEAGQLCTAARIGAVILESFSRPKARDCAVPSDDVQLHVPGRMTGVFDGASDSLGRQIDGVPIGRLAALAAANAAAALPTEAINWPAENILERLSAAVSEDVQTGAEEGPASTTAMIAFEGTDAVRLVGIGDTGYRINGGPTRVAELAPDRVSIPARVALFRHFQTCGETVQTCEAVSRTCIGKGLAHAVSEGILTQGIAERIIQQVLDLNAAPKLEEDAINLLRGGLQSQFHLANALGSQLGYGVLNGARPDSSHAIDIRVSYQDLATIEIFSDGYLSPPKEVTIAAWEDNHAAIERQDPHKISKALAVKGSTETQYFDDRTIAILRFSGGSHR